MTDGKVAVTSDGNGIANALVEILRASGITAELVDDVSSSGASSVIFLGGLRDVASVDEAVAINHEAFHTARSFKQTTPDGGLFVTVSDLGGDFGLGGSSLSTGQGPSEQRPSEQDLSNDTSPRAWAGGLGGLAKTAAIEWTTTTVRSIDVDRGGRSPGSIASDIADELLGGGSELEIGLGAAGQRITLQSTPVSVQAGAQPLNADDVIVVSGGARGVTAATMIELANHTRATFVLLGRSALTPESSETLGAPDDASLKRVLLEAAKSSGVAMTPKELSSQVSKILANREIEQTLTAIAAAGGQARYVSVDITSGLAVADELSKIRAEFGAITGVVHGAGVLADKLIVDKTDEQFESVFNTKVAGLRALLAATDADPLKLLCLFSSVAARTGNNGQVDYAMANEVLNKVAAAERRRRGETCVVKSLGWGPWDGGMVSPALKAHFASMGVGLIPLDGGARTLVAEIASPQRDEVELVLGGGVTPGSVSAG